MSKDKRLQQNNEAVNFFGNIPYPTQKKSKKVSAERYARNDTLCWTCKRSCRIQGETCSWAESFIPVEGWRAKKGTIIYHLADPLVPESTSSHSYTVIECPQYIERTEFLDYADVVKAVSKELRIRTVDFYQKSTEYIEKYEDRTGKSVPLWAKDEYRTKELKD